MGAAGNLLVVDSSRLRIENAYISNRMVWSVIATSKQVTDLKQLIRSKLSVSKWGSSVETKYQLTGPPQHMPNLLANHRLYATNL